MPADFKPFDKAEWLRLEKKADELRRLTVQTTIWGGSGQIALCSPRGMWLWVTAR